MKNLKLYTILILFLTGFSSCFKEDEPVPPYVSPDGVVTVMAETRPDYSMQTYYDLNTNTFVSSNNREVWDFAFSCEPGENTIYLNSSKKMRVFDTQTNDWTLPVSLSDATIIWKYDESTGEPENTALHAWQTDRVYAIDLGLSTVGNNLGLRKVKFVSADAQSLTFEYTDAQGNNLQTVTLTKNSDYNFTYFSFATGVMTESPEPKKDAYDLLFTQYTARAFYDGSTTEFEYYLVNGVLLNPNGVAVAVDSTDAFEDISFDDLSGFTYSDKRDAIGFDWKSYDIDAGVYTVLVQNTYIVRDRTANFWKLRFVSFTNPLGERGYPTFELSRF